MQELYSICWNITNKCNENCKFCYRKICKDNTLEDNKKIFDNLSKIKIGKITFAGGEPLLYKDLFLLVAYIKSKNSNIKLSLTTNGKIINKQLLEKILKTFDWITFPIDSASSIINDKVGRGEYHLSKVIELLNSCNNKIKIKINTVANKFNLNYLDNIYNIISKYNISRWKIFRFYSIRKGKENKNMFYLNNIESNQIKKYVDDKNRISSINIQYNDINEFETSYFNIYPDGSIENNLNKNIGNLLYDDINVILRLKDKELINHNLRNF